MAIWLSDIIFEIKSRANAIMVFALFFKVAYNRLFTAVFIEVTFKMISCFKISIQLITQLFSNSLVECNCHLYRCKWVCLGVYFNMILSFFLKI